MITIESREKFDEAVKQHNLLLVEFGAVWCVPCKRLEPVLENVMAILKDRVQIMRIDVDSLPELAMEFQVMSVPTVILFNSGAPVERLTGLQPQEKILAKIQPYI